MHQYQVPDNFTNVPTLLVAVRNSRVLHPAGMMAQEIPVLSEYHSGLSQSKSNVFLVRCTFQSGFYRGRNIDVAIAQANGDGWIDVFVQVESDHGPFDDLPSLTSSGPGPIWFFSCSTNSSSSRM
jgi:hypothetical protein